MTDSRFLFAYGSLSEGMVHFNKIAEAVSSSRPAQISGTAYRLQVGFPVVTAEGSDQIPGTLFEIAASDTLWRILDEFHGFNVIQPEKSLYIRRPTEAFCDGNTLNCQIYTINPKKLPRTAQKIEGGDWFRALSEQPPLIEKLTDRQRTYIKRLGASTGREIVPIDMQLYRELMSLEMIVDKGRRLALSSLGQEVYRFLG